MLATLHDVTKKYQTAEAVVDLTLDIPPGQMIGVLGLNGSGKSTLLKLIAGLLFPTRGTIVTFGGCPRRSRARIVYLGETDTLWPWMSPKDARRFMRGLYEDFDSQRFDELCDALAVPDRKTKAMSKGERSRLRLAMALARTAKLYLLDEPLAGIDLISREKVLQSLVREWHTDETILLSTHEVAEAEGLFDRVLYLRQGRLQLDVDAETLRAEGRSVVQAFKEVLA